MRNEFNRVTPVDQRDAGVRALRRFIPLPGGDSEAAAERKLLRRIDVKDAVQR